MHKKKKIMEDLLLFVAKTYRHISIERSEGWRHSVMHEDRGRVLLNHKQMGEHGILSGVAKRTEK
jgi:hypothetical protein